MKHSATFAVVSVLAATFLVLPAHAQLKRYAVTPAGGEFHRGTSANTFPFRGVSSRYQQIHDAVDMQLLHGGGVMLMTALAFRPGNAYTLSARSWDVQLTLSPTTVTAANMSTTFSANVTTTPSVVLPYTTINAPTVAGQNTPTPNPIGWVFPFNNLFIYTPLQGQNLLWEWQNKNGTVVTSAFVDAFSGTAAMTPLAVQGIGTGCTATGRTAPAQAVATFGSTVTLGLTNAPANAPAVLWIGATRRELRAGWCTSLYINPLLAIPGVADASGTWNALSLSSASVPASYFEVFCQFGFADKGLGGFGLSNMAGFAGNPNNGRHVTRLWVVNSANGHENDPTGSMAKNYGLIAHFEIK